MPEISAQLLTAELPDISHIITEDDEPVDNWFSEKQQRLLAESLNSSWKPGRLFIAAANVGIFYAVHQPPIVPDMFLSLDVQLADNIWEKRHRSYFLWEFGKPPEVVVEIVSNTKGGETDSKFRKYAQMGVAYYIILDPQQVIQKNVLRVYELTSGGYIPKIDRHLTHIRLGVTLWRGIFEGADDLWLRWCDADGNLILTGLEQAEQEKQRADTAEKKTEKLAEKLRLMGIDPDL